MIVLILVGTIWTYALGWPFQGYDVGRWLLPWYEHLADNGPIGAFAVPFSNYTPPYLYTLAAVSLLDGLAAPVTLIKLASVAGTCWLVLAVYRLLIAAGAERPAEKAAIVFLLPTALLNAPVLGQCDAMWTAACILAVAASIRERPVAMLLWCGVAIAFKAQAAFLAPYVFSRLLFWRVPPALWLIPPAIYAAAMLPAWMVGWPAADLATVYLRQAEYFNTVGNASNPWAAVSWTSGKAGIEYAWVGYSAALGAVAAYIGWLHRRSLDARQAIAAALLASMILPALLPKMHERYFFLADILAFAFCWIARGRRGIAVALLVQASSVLALFGYLVKLPLLPVAGSLLTFGALALLLLELRPTRQERPTAPDSDRAYA